MKKTVSLLLTVALSCGVASGCSEKIKTGAVMEAEDSYAYVIPQLGDEVMPIVSYTNPNGTHTTQSGTTYQSLITDETFRKIEELGINMMYANSAWGNVEETLSMCDKYNMAALICDEFVVTNEIFKCENGAITDYKDRTETDRNLIREKLYNRVDSYANHQSFAGYSFWDEQGAVTFPNTAAVQAVFKEKCPDKLFFCNLLGGSSAPKDRAYGWWADSVTPTDVTLKIYASTWNVYVEHFLETVKPDVLSYDHYPWSAYETIAATNVSNMETASKLSREKKVPFWNFVQTCCWNKEDNRVPNYHEMAWNINMSLAFGAQAIECFLIFPAATDWTEQGISVNPFDLYGNTTQLYDDLKPVLLSVKAVDHILMKSVHKGVMQTSGKYAPLQSLMYPALEEFNQVTGISSDNTYALAGCFNYRGHTALYVTNALIDQERKADIVVNFSRKVKGYCIQNGSTMNFADSAFTIPSLGAGEGAVIVIE